MTATSSRLVSCGVMLVGALLVGACDSNPPIQSVGQTGGTSGSGTGAGGRGGSGSGTGAGGTGMEPVRPGAGGGGGSGMGAGGAGMTPGNDKCSATSAMAKPVPVDIYIVLDRSGSMNEYADGTGGLRPKPDPIPGGMTMPSKWFSMKEALAKFVNAPASAGISLGLNYFPNGLSCNLMNYTTPAVPVAELPGVAMPFLMNLNAAMPEGGTPTRPALEGAIQYAKAREMMTGRRLAIALATDGQPNNCMSSVNSVSDVAAMAAAQGILTFVIGVGPSLQNLNQIAVAGGTKMSYQVASATADELAAAFKAVQTQATKLACSFAIPPPPAGMSLDPMKVNVQFAGATPAATFDIGQVANRGACGAQGGWFFDNPMNPTSVSLCDASCQKVNSSGEGEIKLLFGCASVIIK